MNPAERVQGPVWRLELPSRTLPPFVATNSYLIVDSGVAAIVDPGFHEQSSLAVLRSALESLSVGLLKCVLLTHAHDDHTAGIELVCAEFDVGAVYAHPLELQRLARRGTLALTDDRVLTVGGALLRALHTPGHSPGHLAFHLPEANTLLAGDLVAGSGSVWVGVPDGDLTAYLGSLQRLAALPGLQKLGPGHGPVSARPYDRLQESHGHRVEREGQVMRALESPLHLEGLRAVVYPELPSSLVPAAEASLLAHLRKLMSEMRVVHLGDDERGPFVARNRP